MRRKLINTNLLSCLWIFTIALLITLSVNITTFAASDFVIITNDEGRKVLTEYKGDDSIVVIPEGVQVVEGFQNNKKIKKVVLPESIEEIQHSAFSGCTNLKTINFPENLNRIWTSAFLRCKSLKTINLNKNLKQIDEYAFGYCSNLKKVTVAKGNKYFKVKKGVLYSHNMKELYLYPPALKSTKKFEMPKTVKLVYPCAFSDNKYLKKIIIKSKLKNAPGDYDNCKSLETVIFKKACYATPSFANCKKLKKVVLAEGTKRICEYSFEGCRNLESINYPASLKGIDRYAFKGCKKLKQPILPETVKVDEKAFD